MYGTGVRGVPMDGIIEIGEARRGLGDAVLERFALRVVARVAGRPVIETGEPERELLRLLVRHARNGDPALLNAVYSELRTRRVPAEQVVDVYIPAAARELGNAWHDGELDILETTLSIARLQAILRELGRAWIADQSVTASEARVLLAVPEREQHTLGALIVAHQLRRMGVSVNVQLMTPMQRLAQLVAENRYDAVFLSIANRSSLDSCQRLVETIRRSVSYLVPLVVGGPLLDLEGELCSSLGADLTTNDIGLAMEVCGLHAFDLAAQ